MQKSRVPTSLQHAIRQLSGEQLHLFLSTEATSPAWNPDDLPALWNHQLKTSIIADLASDAPESAPHIQQLCRSATPPFSDMASLLHHPAPDMQLLTLARAVSKSRVTRAAGTGSDRIARVLYFAILAAMTRSGQPSPTKLSASELSAGFAWTLSHPWLDSTTAGVVRAASDAIRSPHTPDGMESYAGDLPASHEQ